MSNKEIPAAAFNFKAAHASVDPDTMEVKLLARSSKSIEHFYWGNVVHDLEGMRLTKPRVTLDFNHNADEIIGYLDNFDITDEGLVCTGKLISFKDDDRAAQIAYLARQGVMWEASISFGGDGIEVEQVGDEPVMVNGREFSNGSIVRKWPFRQCAICSQGADEHTSSTVLSNSDDRYLVKFLGRSEMSEKQNEELNELHDDAAAPDQFSAAEVDEAVEEAVEEVVEEAAELEPEEVVEEAAEEVAEDATDLSADARKLCARFIAEFGNDGAQWFADGLSFEDATELHNQNIKQQRDELLEEVAELKAKLATLDRGEDEPLEFSSAPKAEELEKAKQHAAYRSQIGSDAGAALVSHFSKSFK